MREVFEGLAARILEMARGEEVLSCHFTGEESDFVRINRAAYRQAGGVRQMQVRLRLISDNRQAEGTLTVSGEGAEDEGRASTLLRELREAISLLPEDPHVCAPAEVRSTESAARSELPPPEEAVGGILRAGEGKDLVGIYASGGIFTGFADTMGQRNWHSAHHFNFDWSLYAHRDKAVKCRYAGRSWEADAFSRKMAEATAALEVLSRPPEKISPGRFRVFLSPAALGEFVQMVAYRGFGLRAQRTKRSSLLKMLEGGERLNPLVSICENTEEGASPNFQEEGFVRPPRVSLMEKGELRDALVSPRSAREFGAAANGASAREAPESLDVAGGSLASADALQMLGRGLYVGDLWYLNYSDLPSCRITGLTRFATFWVEDGEIQAPVDVMRFDESAYRVLGKNLVGLTREREWLMSAGTYKSRSSRSTRVPGALVEDFTLTL